MNSSFTKIYDKKLCQYNKEILCLIIVNILFFIIALINEEIYSTIVSLARISILWIFICIISYKENVGDKNLLTIMETTSLFLILLCALNLVRVNGTKLEFFSLSFLFINLSNYIFINKIENQIIKKNYLIIIYFLFAAIYIFNINEFNSNKVNYLYIGINFIISSYNLIKLERDKLNNIKHYKMIKVSSILTFLNVILGILYFAFYKKEDLKLLQGTISLLFFNYTYYLYLYTIKYIVKNPYYGIIYKNEELNNKSYKLKKINEIIKNEIEISNKIKSDINQRQELLDQSLDAMPNSWAITDYNFNIIYVNHKFKSIFGDKIKNFYQILNRIENSKELEYKISKNKTKEYILEETIYFDDGIYSLCINNNLLEKNYLICITDVTRDIELENELKNISTEYKLIIENIPCAVMLRNSSEVAKDINVYSINKAFEEVFGYNSDKIRGMNLKDYYDKFKIDFLDDRDYTILNLDINEKVNNIQNNADKYNLITATMLNDKNEEKNLEISVDDFEDNGKIYKLLILKDVTEEINTYKYINSQNNTYKKVLNTIPDGLVIESEDSKEILYVNKKFMEIFAIDDIKDFIYKYRDRIETKFLYNLQNGNKEKSIYIVNKDNKIKEIKVSSKTWYINDERFTVKIIEDLSQQREAERMKEILIGQREYDKMKMEFYANMSHELKTPLNNIYSSLQLIEILYSNGKIKDKNKEVYNHIKTTKQNMFRLIRLIDNIINISQVKSEIYKIKYINFDIVYLIEEIVDSIRPYAKSRKVNLIFDTNEEEILVGLDPETIERIVLNLLSNSIKFTKENGEIFVGVYKVDKKIKITVKDNGIGIDEEKLSDIFDRFKQIEDGSISNEFGSGIGLYLSKSLIEFQGGNIDIKSKLNEGTEITVEFPIKTVKQEDEMAVEYNQNIEKFKIEFFDIYRS